MPDVEDVIERAEGVATTEQVRAVGPQRPLVLPPRGGAVQISNDLVSVGSISVLISSSSPWWTTRLIEHFSDEDVYVLAPEAGRGTSVTSLSDVDVAADRVSSGRPRSARRRLNLDFGLNVTPAFGTELAGRLLERTLESVWQEGVQPAWLRADPPAAIAAAQPVLDDAEWDNSDDSPRWLSMSALSYRGGGVMRRRAHRSSGD